MSVDVHDGDEFGERDERETHRAVLVKEREPVFAGARREDEADAEAEGARYALRRGMGTKARFSCRKWKS